MLSIDNDLKDAYEHLNEYRNSYKLLKNWRQEIINSFHIINGHIISNGRMERANRDIKTIIRHAYGFKNFSRLRNRIMYIKNDDASMLGYRKYKT